MYLKSKLPAVDEAPTIDREIAMRAAALIRKHGLSKNALYSHTKGTMCFRGAIFMAESNGAIHWPTLATAELETRISRAADFWHVCDAVDWNNHPMTTASDVIARLEMAAGKL